MCNDFCVVVVLNQKGIHPPTLFSLLTRFIFNEGLVSLSLAICVICG